MCDESGNVKIVHVTNTIGHQQLERKKFLKNLQCILITTTENRLKSDLQDLRKEALVNDTIRNILVNEDNFFEWKFSIFPTNVPFNVATFGISIKFPGKCLLLCVYSNIKNNYFQKNERTKRTLSNLNC